MSAQIAIPHETGSGSGLLARRLPRLAGLLATPGFLGLSVSNGLVHAASVRMYGLIIAWLVLEMTGSKLWLGIVTGLPAFGVVACSLLGGALADSRDPRRLLILSRGLLAAVASLTAALAISDGLNLALLIPLVLLTTSLMAADMPVARMLVLHTVGSSRLVSAGAANLITQNFFNIVGPLALGVLIARASPGAALVLLFGGYLAAAFLVLRLPRESSPAGRGGAHPVADIVAGFRYMQSEPVVAALVAMGLLVMLAGVYFSMVPVFAREVLHVGAEGLGMLAASFSVGSLFGAAYMTAGGAVPRRGRFVAILSLVFGTGMVAFALSPSLAISCAISFGMGLTAAFWQNLIQAMLQTAAAPEMRGRAVGVFTMGFQLAGLGGLIGGILATLLGAQAAVAVAGVAFAGLSMLIYTFCRELWRID